MMLHRAKPFVDVSRIIEELHSSDLTSDHYVSSFEEKLRKKIGVPYCAAVDQGRAALLVALRILGIGEGDEVIAPSFICSVVVEAIREVGATPVLADSLVEDFNISPAEVLKKVSHRTRAIIAAHIHGIPCDVEEIATIAKHHNCYLIEDCAHTMSAKYLGRNVGTFGDLAFFSMNFDKPFSTGQGGAIAVNSEQLIDNAKAVLARYERASANQEKTLVYGLLIEHLLTQKDVYNELLSIGSGAALIREDRQLFQLVDRLLLANASEVEFRNHVYQYFGGYPHLTRQIVKKVRTLTPHFMRGGRISSKGEIEPIETKTLLMGSMRAIVGSIGLDSLDQVDIHRNEIANMFEKRLGRLRDYLRPTISHKKTPTFLRYNVLNRTKCQVPQISKYARERNIEIGNFNWPAPVHLITPYGVYGKGSELKTSEMISENVINLPVHCYVNRNDVDAVVSVLEQFDVTM